MAFLVQQSTFVTDVFGYVGDALTVFLCLSTAHIFKRIWENNSTEGFSGIPYVGTLFNCLFSLWYGIVTGTPNIIIAYGICVVIETIYVVMFHKYASEENGRYQNFILLSLVIFAFIVTAVVSEVAIHDEHMRMFFCGIVANIVSLAMYGSSITTIISVINTKSVEFMPFFLTLSTFVCALSSFISGFYGIEIDYYVIVPNAVGCLFGGFQLISYGRYGGYFDECYLWATNLHLNLAEMV